MERCYSRYSLALLSSVVTFAACGQVPEATLQAQPPSQDDAIIYGQPAPYGTYPNTGALLIREYGYDGAISGSLCTGTLITPDAVLTAAHCVGDYAQSRQFFYSTDSDVRLPMGSKAVPNLPSIHPAQAVVAHPAYRKFSHGGLHRANDIAVVFLATPILDVQPATLLRPSERGWLQVGSELDIVGYGMRVPPEFAAESDPQTGEKYYARSVVGELGDYELQAGTWLPTPQKCHGDSGGPSFINTAYGARLVGVTSRAYDANGCTRGGVDTRPDSYLSWIENALDAACRSGLRTACYRLQ